MISGRRSAVFSCQLSAFPAEERRLGISNNCPYRCGANPTKVSKGTREVPPTPSMSMVPIQLFDQALRIRLDEDHPIDP